MMRVTDGHFFLDQYQSGCIDLPAFANWNLYFDWVKSEALRLYLNDEKALLIKEAGSYFCKLILSMCQDDVISETVIDEARYILSFMAKIERVIRRLSGQLDKPIRKKETVQLALF